MFKIQPSDSIKSPFSAQENCRQRKHARLPGVPDVPDGVHVHSLCILNKSTPWDGDIWARWLVGYSALGGIVPLSELDVK